MKKREKIREMVEEMDEETEVAFLEEIIKKRLERMESKKKMIAEE